MKIVNQYDLHKIPIGSLIVYKDRYEDRLVSGHLLEILPNTCQYKLHRNDFVWKHYIMWDKYEYSYEKPDEAYEPYNNVENHNTNTNANEHKLELDYQLMKIVALTVVKRRKLVRIKPIASYLKKKKIESETKRNDESVKRRKMRKKMLR